MISVSLTERQGNALETLATDDNRKVGAVARLAITKYLIEKGYLIPTLPVDEDEDE